MEILLAIAVAGIFLGPTAYRTYERYKRRKMGLGAPPKKAGPSYFRRLLGMLGPVLVLIVFLVLVAVGLFILGGHEPPVGAVLPALGALI